MKELANSLMKDIIEEFINDESINVLKIPMQRLQTYIDIMKELGCEDLGEYETNGYSVDFWYPFKKDDMKLTISGDLWYSEEWTISKELI